MEEITKIILAMYVVVILFYAPLLFWVHKRKLERHGQKYFFKGVISILESCEKDEECIEQTSLLYKRLSAHYRSITNSYRSSVELLEELIIRLDTLNEKQFKKWFDIAPPKEHRQRIVNIHGLMKTKNPYSSLSSKEANLLMVLSGAIESKNVALGNNSVSQIADEFEILESSLREQSKRNTVSFLVAVVSVILTTFFGIVSFIQLFFRD